MFSDLLIKIKNQANAKLPFVVYRKPNEESVAAIFQKDNELRYITDYTETGFVFAPFDADRPTILLRPDEMHRASYSPNSDTKIYSDQFPRNDRAAKEFHIDLIKKGLEEIHMGPLKKVVLSRTIEANFERIPLKLFQQLLSLYPKAFCYLWYHPKVGMWAGATPEVLLSIENQILTTMSLAGTLPYIGNENPKWGIKELEEQALVTEYISKVLADKVLDLAISDTESIKAGSLWHLRTSISGTLKKDGLGAILNVLHPTPAVCGFPKSQAKDFIIRNENYDREYYTGFLGELNFKKTRERATAHRNPENRVYRSIKSATHLFVNLRCMQLVRDKAIVYVGGGITKDSEPEKEWQETIYKGTTMLGVLPDSNN